MLLPDVTALVNDPQVGGGQAFSVKRVTRKHNLVSGDTTTTETFNCTGNVQPQGGQSLQQMSPQDKKGQNICVRSTFHFQLGSQVTAGQVDADIVCYNGKKYKVISVQDWYQWGFTIATATEMKGE